MAYGGPGNASINAGRRSYGFVGRWKLQPCRKRQAGGLSQRKNRHWSSASSGKHWHSHLAIFIAVATFRPKTGGDSCFRQPTSRGQTDLQAQCPATMLSSMPVAGLDADDQPPPAGGGACLDLTLATTEAPCRAAGHVAPESCWLEFQRRQLMSPVDLSQCSTLPGEDSARGFRIAELK